LTYYSPQLAKNLIFSVKTTYILIIRRKPMVNTSRENNQIILTQSNAHPLILLPTNIKVPLPIANVPNLLVLMQMLTEERLHLFLVDVAHSLRRDADFIAVLVAALGGQGIDEVDCWAVAVEDADRLEVGLSDGAAGVVGQALVTLFDCKLQLKQEKYAKFFRAMMNADRLTGWLSYQYAFILSIADGQESSDVRNSATDANDPEIQDQNQSNAGCENAAPQLADDGAKVAGYGLMSSRHRLRS